MPAHAWKRNVFVRRQPGTGVGSSKTSVLYWEYGNEGAGVGVTGEANTNTSVTSETNVRTTDLGIDGLSAAVHLGSGGSANVFAARSMETGEQVAVKLLRASADSEKERTRFEREQQALRTLASQEGIVPVLDAGLTDRGEPYFLMPLMEGSLQDRIDNDGAVDWQTATLLIAEVADTVEFAHTQKILHRDIKPGNILLDEEGVPRVADFGIAKLLDSSMSKSSKSLGTPSFMPPERFNGEEATAASDVYGLAATLSALITGSAPFLTGENDTDVAVMMRVVNEEPPSLVGYDVPEAVRSAVHDAMSKSPDERPQTAGEFASILRLAIDPHMDPALAGPVTIAIPRRNLTIPDGPATRGSSQRAGTIELGEHDNSSKKRAWLLPAVAAALFIALLGSGAAFALGGGEDEAGEVETADTAVAARDSVKTGVAGGGEANVDDAVVDGEDETEIPANGEGSGESTEGSGGTTEGSGGTTEGSGGTTEGSGGTTDDGSGTDDGGTSSGEGELEGGAGEEGGAGGDGPVTIDPPARPNACFSSSSSSVETGQPVSFSNCSSGATSYSWGLGDGTTSSNRNATKSWTTTGSKTVTLTATGLGGSDSTTRTITVTVTAKTEAPPDPEPDACFTASSTSITAGQSVTFTNCSAHATSYSWDFGGLSTSSQISPTHTFNSSGSYTVRLTARGTGGSDWFSRDISVSAVATPGPDAEDRWVTLASDETSTASDLTKGTAVNARVLGDSTGGSYTYTLTWEGNFNHTRQSDDAYSFWIDYEVIDASGASGSSGRIHLNVEAKADAGPEDRSRTITMSAAQNQIDVNLLGAGGNSARWLGGDDKHALYGTGRYLYAREDPGASSHTFQFYELLNQVIIVRWTVTVNVQAQS